MNKIIKFGEDVEGYNIPVLNEREIRAAAGLLFLMMFTSIMIVIFERFTGLAIRVYPLNVIAGIFDLGKKVLC